MRDGRPATFMQTVVFHEAKDGAPGWEWEDCAGYSDTVPDSGRPARFAVVDGATEAYDSIRWVGQLVESFVGADAPSVSEPDEVDRWFGLMQERWVEESPAQFANYFEERKFAEVGSFATFLGCEVHGVGQPDPYWCATALGDTVLFQVRAGRVVAQLPKMSADDFGLNPDGVSTQPAQRQRMRAGLCFADGRLEVGDVLFLATDALAACLVAAADAGLDRWSELAAVQHPQVFRRWVGERRQDRDRRLKMKDDDVTLLRAEVTATDTDVLVACR